MDFLTMPTKDLTSCISLELFDHDKEPNGGSTTSSLRQFRKKDVDKTQIEQQSPKQMSDTHVARVAPHNHYPPVTSDVYRYPTHQFPGYSPQLKYSDLAETSQSNPISTSVIQKPKPKDYMEMCNVQQQHLNNHQQYSPDNGQYMHKDSAQGYPAGFKPESHFFSKEQHQYQQLPHHSVSPKFNAMMAQNMRKYNPAPADNAFLNKLSKIHPSMARSIMSDHHMQDAQPNYHPMDQRGMYGQQSHRYYSGPIHHQPNSYSPNPNYLMNGPHSYVNYSPSSCSYPRSSQMGSVAPRYPPMERSMSPGRRGYPENMHMPHMNYHTVQQKIPSGHNYSPQFNRSPEYAQHYQHRRMPQDCYPQSCRPTQYMQNHHQMSGQDMQELPENTVSPSDNLKKFIENWADEEASSEINPMEANMNLRDKLRDDAPPGTLYMINATDVQYFENNGIPIVTSDNGGLQLTSEYLLKNGLVDNTGVVRIIEANKELSIDSSGNQERIVNLQIMEAPKSDCMMASKHLRHGEGNLGQSNVLNKSEDESRRVVIHQNTILNPGSASGSERNTQQPIDQISLHQSIVDNLSITKELVDKNCSPINMDHLEHNLGFSEPEPPETESENIAKPDSPKNSNRSDAQDLDGMNLSSEDLSQNSDDSQYKSPGSKSMPIIDFFGEPPIVENEENDNDMTEKEDGTVNEEIISERDNISEDEESKQEIISTAKKSNVIADEGLKVNITDSKLRTTDRECEENTLPSQIGGEKPFAVNNTVIVTPENTKTEPEANEDVKNEPDHNPTKSVLKHANDNMVCTNKDDTTEAEVSPAFSHIAETSIVPIQVVEQKKRTFSVDDIMHHIGNNMKRGSKELESLCSSQIIISFIEKEIEFSSLEHIMSVARVTDSGADKESDTILTQKQEETVPSSAKIKVESDLKEPQEPSAVIKEEAPNTEISEEESTPTSNISSVSGTVKCEDLNQASSEEFRNILRVEETSVVLQVAGELMEISVNVVDGRKVINVTPLSGSTTVVDYNDNYELSANISTVCTSESKEDSTEKLDSSSTDIQMAENNSNDVEPSSLEDHTIIETIPEENAELKDGFKECDNLSDTQMLKNINKSQDDEKELVEVKPKHEDTSRKSPETDESEIAEPPISLEDSQDIEAAEECETPKIAVPDNESQITENAKQILEVGSDPVVLEGKGLLVSSEPSNTLQNEDNTDQLPLAIVLTPKTNEVVETQEVFPETDELTQQISVDNNSEQCEESIGEDLSTLSCVGDEMQPNSLETIENLEEGREDKNESHSPKEIVQDSTSQIIEDNGSITEIHEVSNEVLTQNDFKIKVENDLERVDEVTEETIASINEESKVKHNLVGLHEVTEDYVLKTDENCSDNLESLIENTSDEVTEETSECNDTTKMEEGSNCHEKDSGKIILEDQENIILLEDTQHLEVILEQEELIVQVAEEALEDTISLPHVETCTETVMKTLSDDEDEACAAELLDFPLEDEVFIADPPAHEVIVSDPLEGIGVSDSPEIPLEPVTTTEEVVEGNIELVHDNLDTPAQSEKEEGSKKQVTKVVKSEVQILSPTSTNIEDHVTVSKKTNVYLELNRKYSTDNDVSEYTAPTVTTKAAKKLYESDLQVQHDIVSSSKKEDLPKQSSKTRKTAIKRSKRLNEKVQVKNEQKEVLKLLVDKRKRREELRQKEAAKTKKTSKVTKEIVKVKAEPKKNGSSEHDEEYVDFKELLRARKLKKLKKLQETKSRESKVSDNPKTKSSKTDIKDTAKLKQKLGRDKKAEKQTDCCIGCTKNTVNKKSKTHKEEKHKAKKIKKLDQPKAEIPTANTSKAGSPDRKLPPMKPEKESAPDLKPLEVSNITADPSIVLKKIKPQKRVSFSEDLPSPYLRSAVVTSMVEPKVSSKSISPGSHPKDPRRKSKTSLGPILVPSVSELIEENGGSGSKKKISLADYVSRKRKATCTDDGENKPVESKERTDKRLKLDSSGCEKTSDESTSFSSKDNNGNKTKTLDDVKTSFVIHSSDWEDSNSLTATPTRSKEECLIQDFSGLIKNNQSNKPVIDVNELSPLENPKDRKLQEYKDKVDSQLSSLNIKIPKIKPPDSKTSKLILGSHRSPRSVSLVTRFLNNEKLTQSEMEKIRKIISYKRSMQHPKNGRSPSKSPAENEPAGKGPASSCSTFSTSSPNPTYEVRNNSRLKADLKEVRLHLKKVNAKRKLQMVSDDEDSSSVISNQSDNSQNKKNVGYSVINRLGEDGLPKIIFKRNKKSALTKEPVVELVKLNLDDLEKVKEKYNVTVTQIM